MVVKEDGTIAFVNTGVTPPVILYGVNSYGALAPISATAGGLSVIGLSDTDASALTLSGIVGSTNPTDTTPAIVITGSKSNGGTGTAILGDLETLFQIRNRTVNLITVLGNGFTGFGTVTPTTRVDLDTGAMSFTEMTAPAAGAANTVRLFARDDGAGITQLCARFATGDIIPMAWQDQNGYLIIGLNDEIVMINDDVVYI
jgi:hypothetical protein